jgi:hypothetical protein
MLTRSAYDAICIFSGRRMRLDATKACAAAQQWDTLYDMRHASGDVALLTEIMAGCGAAGNSDRVLVSSSSSCHTLLL